LFQHGFHRQFNVLTRELKPTGMSLSLDHTVDQLGLCHARFLHRVPLGSLQIKASVSD
jgi:hypothetical protein